MPKYRMCGIPWRTSVSRRPSATDIQYVAPDMSCYEAGKQLLNGGNLLGVSIPVMDLVLPEGSVIDFAPFVVLIGGGYEKTG